MFYLLFLAFESFFPAFRLRGWGAAMISGPKGRRFIRKDSQDALRSDVQRQGSACFLIDRRDERDTQPIFGST